MTQNTVTPSQYLTVAEVARTLRLSPMTVYRMVSGGQLESIRTGVNGRSIRILSASVDAHQRAALAPHQRPVPHVPGQTTISA